MQGFNMGRYRPPDADPRKHSFNSTHPLGSRARRLASHSTLTVRFELPFPLICLTCTHSLPQGRRFNALKSPIGTYHSTKIYRFECKCIHCSSKFDVQTDPEHAQYVVGKGVRRKVEEWDPAENGGFEVYDSERKVEAEGDAFANVERVKKEDEKAKERQKRVEELEAVQEGWSDPARANKRLRDQFRRDKRKRMEQAERDRQAKARIGWREETVLLPTTPRTAERDGVAWRDAVAHSSRRSIKSSVGNTQLTSTPATTKVRAGSTSAAQKLKDTLVANTRTKRDPFLIQMREQSDPSVKRLVVRSSTSSGSSKHT